MTSFMKTPILFSGVLPFQWGRWWAASRVQNRWISIRFLHADILLVPGWTSAKNKNENVKMKYFRVSFLSDKSLLLMGLTVSDHVHDLPSLSWSLVTRPTMICTCSLLLPAYGFNTLILLRTGSSMNILLYAGGLKLGTLESYDLKAMYVAKWLY